MVVVACYDIMMNVFFLPYLSMFAFLTAFVETFITAATFSLSGRVMCVHLFFAGVRKE